MSVSSDRPRTAVEVPMASQSDGPSPDHTRRVSGGDAAVASLLAAGVDHSFCVPGESFLGLLEAMHREPRIRPISTRHEEGAAFMAVGYARLTGRPAVAMGTRMVGGANLAIGVHTAYQDSVPMVAVVGQTPTAFRFREAFQEVELEAVFTPLAKVAIEVPSADRLGELTARAARIAVSGRPGPVVLILREELTQAMVDVGDPIPPIERARPAADPQAVEAILAMSREAERPIMLVGGGILAAGASDALVRFSHAEHLPVVTAWRRPDAFPNDDALYLGWAGLRSPTNVLERLASADLIIAIGTRLGEFTTYRYRIPAPGTRFVHVDLQAEALGAHRIAEIVCQADARLFLEAIGDAAAARPLPASIASRRGERNAIDRATWEGQTTPTRGIARSGFVDQQAVVAHLRERMPPDAITVTDGGNFAGWPARFLRWNRPGSFLGPTSGAMGYGIPAAIGAKLARPSAPVITFVGDGGFLMTGVELETAVRENIPIVSLVYDNGQYGTIRMHQRHDYPDTPLGTSLGAVDFATFATSLGALGIAVRDDAEFPAAFAEALASGRPSVLHLKVDPEQLSVGDEH
jgi:acetolactate synthase-1/2/3 large subunit